MRTRNLMIAFAMTGFIFSTACADNKKDKPKETKEITAEKTSEEVAVEETPNIVGVAIGNENFSTLVAAVKAANLVETLSGNGPFTVFAPVNAAFDKLPEGTVAGLLKPESKEALTSLFNLPRCSR